jgi:hypothetical protein
MRKLFFLYGVTLFLSLPVLNSLGYAEGGTTCASAICITQGLYSSNQAFPQQWFAYKPSVNGTIVIQSCNLTTMDTYVYLYDSCSHYLAYNDDYCGVQSYLSYNVTADKQYYIVWTSTYTSGISQWSLTGPAGVCLNLDHHLYLPLVVR